MTRHLRARVGMAAVSTFALTLSVIAQQPATTREAPTKKDPLEFSCFNVSLDTGMAGMTEISLERWTTDAERQSLLDVLGGAKWGEGGQAKLLKALQNVKPRTGFIRTPNSLGWDLKYAWESALPDGTWQIVIATDKPVSMGAAMGGGEAMDYPFTFIEMRMKANEKGEGRMLAASAITVKDGKLALENYGNEPVRLTQIIEKQKKPKN